MKITTFKGGAHPPEKKELSKDFPIEYVIPFTKTVAIPVTMGGAKNQSIVAVGDTVAKGQIIANSDAFMSVPVHASIAGIVKKIEPRTVTGNVEVPCIVIQSDDSERTDFMQPLDPFSCSKKESLERVRQAGITGMGGASFPTHVKLNPPAGKTIQYVLANAAECEPYLTIDERTIAETPDKIIDGLSIAMKIVKSDDENAKDVLGIVVLEANKKYLVPVLQDAINKSEYAKRISICLCKTKYPQGGEKNLVQVAVHREIPSGGLPADVGCVIQNVGTLCAISEAFREGKPLIERGLTISGDSVEKAKNLKVPVGTLVGDLIPSVITLKPGVAKIISGGPMMGCSMVTANFPIQKNTSGVLFLTEKEISTKEEDQCINCGKCVNSCSCRLVPVMITRSLKNNDLESAKRYGLMDCVECGTCAYVCPASIKLVQRFRLGKQLVRAEIQRQKELAAREGGK